MAYPRRRDPIDHSVRAADDGRRVHATRRPRPANAGEWVMAILWASTRYHLGNNPGLFQDAQYVGHALRLPFQKTWIDGEAAAVRLIFHTRDVETWAGRRGHKISINDVEIGRLSDGGSARGDTEAFELTIARPLLDEALSGRDQFIVAVDLELDPDHPGLADDFVVTRIESDGTFAARLGWR